MSETPRKSPRWAVIATTVAVAGNVLAGLVPIRSLQQIAPGTGVRLMADGPVAFLIAIATLAIVLPFAIASFRKERCRLLAVFALCLALTPFFFSGFVMRHYADMRGVILNP